MVVVVAVVVAVQSTEAKGKLFDATMVLAYFFLHLITGRSNGCASGEGVYI